MVFLDHLPPQLGLLASANSRQVEWMVSVTPWERTSPNADLDSELVVAAQCT